jgi:hypothetical protein
MNLKLRYFDREKSETVHIDIPSDVVAITIPATEELPEFEVNVNTDMVLVDGNGGRLGALTYSDCLAEAQDAGEYEADETEAAERSDG